MPTSANVLPCSRVSSSGLYITGNDSPVVVLISRALASWLPPGPVVAGGRRFSGCISGPPLKLGAQPAHEVVDERPAQLFHVGRRRRGRAVRGGAHRGAGVTGAGVGGDGVG